MKIKNKRGFFKNVFLATTLSAFLLGGSLAGADEIKPKPKTEQTLENKVSEDKKVSNPKIEINFNYGTGTGQGSAEYSSAYSGFYGGNLYTNFSGITSAEKTQVEDVINDVKDGTINSYEDFINATDDFSENQKIILLAAIGDSLNWGSYNSDYQGEVFPQEIFFERWQDYLETGNPNSLGVCRHLVSHLVKFINDEGGRASAVTGRASNGEGHAYVMLKTENGTAIVDYGNILIMGTKNIEKILEVYQKNADSIAFQHLFFEDNKLKYRLITKDGKNFLKFIGYDETSKSLKKKLLSDPKSQSDIKIDFNLEDYLTSAKISCFGFFMNAGEIRGNSSPIDNLTLAQVGYDNSFSIGSVNIEPSADFTFGDGGLYGITGDLKVNTNNKEGLNLGSRLAGEISWIKDSALFHDLVLEAGASYKIPTKDIDIAPYLVGQLALFPGDLGTYNFTPMLNEVRAGVAFDIKMPNDINISFDPYFLRRIWNHEVGADLKIGTKNVSLHAGGSVGFSDYDFCPDTYNLNVGAEATFGNFTIGAEYNSNGTNYDGEIEKKSSFSINGNWKY